MSQFAYFTKSFTKLQTEFENNLFNFLPHFKLSGAFYLTGFLINYSVYMQKLIRFLRYKYNLFEIDSKTPVYN